MKKKKNEIYEVYNKNGLILGTIIAHSPAAALAAARKRHKLAWKASRPTPQSRAEQEMRVLRARIQELERAREIQIRELDKFRHMFLKLESAVKLFEIGAKLYTREKEFSEALARGREKY